MTLFISASFGGYNNPRGPRRILHARLSFMELEVDELYPWQFVRTNVEELFAAWVGALLEFVLDAFVEILCEWLVRRIALLR
jgi:hypothetical protein